MYLRIILVITSLLSLGIVANSQVQVSKSDVDYSLKIEKDSIYHILTFWKDKDSSVYTSIKYSISDFSSHSTDKYLKDEISIINQLWDLAEDSIEFKLKSVLIGYPLIYEDVLVAHIQAFNNSKDWQNHIKQNGKKLDYKILKKVMLENDVYKPLNNFLRSKGYIISGFETEKHGFVTKDVLIERGFKGNEIIPVPFLVWATVEEIK